MAALLHHPQSFTVVTIRHKELAVEAVHA